MHSVHSVPKEVLLVAKLLEASGFEAFLVGGCLRDLLIGRTPKDWDLTTNATPDQIQSIFPDSVYENRFGTVGVKTDSEDPKLKVIEVTTFRVESVYSDMRHPDEVKFTSRIEEDLSRRDFTVNALAARISDQGELDEIVDPFGGRADLKAKIMRTVGAPDERLTEDALRLLRGARLSIDLDFSIEPFTRRAIEKHASLLEAIAKERIRDEFSKLIMTPHASRGVVLLEELNLLRYVIPELREGLGVGQNKHHIYTVFEHNVRALDYAAKQNYSLLVRLASLLHDVGKPRVKRGDGPDSTFHHHETVGAKMAFVIMDRLRYSKELVDGVTHLVRQHLFYYNVDEVSEAGVRRFLRRVGPEYIDDLLKVREADRIGSGVPKAVTYKMRHLLFMIEKVKHDPLSPKMLRVDGSDLMSTLMISPGPRIGFILATLLEEVIDDPLRNEKEYLLVRAKELNALSDEDLKSLALGAKSKTQEFESGVEAEIKKRFRV